MDGGGGGGLNYQNVGGLVVVLGIIFASRGTFEGVKFELV